jgi:hypothetical protein
MVYLRLVPGPMDHGAMHMATPPDSGPHDHGTH